MLGWEFYAFAVSVLLYHACDFAIQYHYHPATTDKNSCLLSPAYLIAMAVAVLEYFLEQWLLPGAKDTVPSIKYIGLVMVIIGDSVRKVAMIHAGKNFTHLIRTHKNTQHQLITTGLYSCCRHPAYVGWTVWSIGTQVLLCNPISICLFMYASWMFFADRIPYEESLLLSFFGDTYLDYQRRTPLGLPFIEKGSATMMMNYDSD